MKSDAEMIQSPGDWPWYPLLPIKRRSASGSWPETAVLVASDIENAASKIRVFNVNLYEIKPEWPVIETHDNVESLISAGWVVD